MLKDRRISKHAVRWAEYHMKARNHARGAAVAGLVLAILCCWWPSLCYLLIVALIEWLVLSCYSLMCLMFMHECEQEHRSKLEP